MFEINYYVSSNGKIPAKRFIDGLDSKMKAKLFGRLELLEEYGASLGMPFARHLAEGIYELRTVQSNNITRVLYFFAANEEIILTHGFVKKTQRTPRREIERAMKIRQDWRARHE